MVTWRHASSSNLQGVEVKARLGARLWKRGVTILMDNPLPRRAAANPTQYNIDAIASLERDALGRRTATERISGVITRLVGNVGFLLAQVLLISGWS
jgi:hypothetical protein